MRYDSTYKPIEASGEAGFQIIAGWQFAENAGVAAAARVLLRDGGAAGPIVADIRLAAGASDGKSFDYPIVLAAGKLYVEVAAGVVRGAVYGR